MFLHSSWIPLEFGNSKLSDLIWHIWDWNVKLEIFHGSPTTQQKGIYIVFQNIKLCFE